MLFNLLKFTLKTLKKVRFYCWFLFFLIILIYLISIINKNYPRKKAIEKLSFIDYDLEHNLLNTKFDIKNLNFNIEAKYFNLTDFYLNHEQIITNNSIKNKKIVFSRKVNAGYANKIYSSLTSILIAILSDSAVLIEWPEIDKYIQPPIKYLFENYDQNKNSELSFDYALTYSLPVMNHTWKAEKDLNILLHASYPKSNRISFHHYTAYFMDLAANPFYYSKLLHYKLVKIETIKKVKHSLQSNLINDSVKIENMLKVSFEVASNLLLNIWRPNEMLANDLNKYYKENEFNSYFIIGLQMRFEYINSEDVNKFIKCALFIEKEYSNGKRVKWFISSDSRTIFNYLKKTYGNKIIEGRGEIGHVQSNKNFYYRAIFDNEVLAKTNEMIITGGSTFGFIAAIKNAKLPFYVEGRKKDIIYQNESCTRMTLNRSPKTPTGFSFF